VVRQPQEKRAAGASPRTALIAAALTLLAVSAWLIGRHDRPHRAAPVKDATLAAALPAATPSSMQTPALLTPRLRHRAPPAPHRHGTAPSLREANLGSLPPLDSPLVPRLADLEKRAKAGDAETGLDLWSGLQQCASVTQQSEIDFLRNADKAQADMFTPVIAKLFDNCKDVGAADIAARYTWLEAAAREGNAQARYFYAIAELDAVGGRDEASRDPETWAAYEETAADYLAELSERCDPYTIAHLAYAYGHGDAMFDVDRQRALAYIALGQRLEPNVDTPPAILANAEKGLAPDAIAEATGEADAFFASYCR
jgi:hypothetical protein